MTVAEYQQAQKDIAEIKAQIAQLRDVVAKGVPAVRGVYGLDQPEAEQPATNAPIPPMLSAHEQVGTPNVNPFQDNFTPNTNTMSMQEIAGQVAPQVDQSLPERLARGAMNIPVGMAAMAEQATSDPAGFGKGTAEYVAEWGQRINPVVSPESMEAKLNFGKQLQTDPIGTTLDVAGVAGTALGFPKLGGKIKGFKSIKEARAAIKDIGKPKVDVPEVVQEPIRSETLKDGANGLSDNDRGRISKGTQSEGEVRTGDTGFHSEGEGKPKQYNENIVERGEGVRRGVGELQTKASEQQPSLGAIGYVEAKKQAGGKYKLFYRGTRNEVFPEQVFDSASEARNYFKVAKAKESQPTTATEVVAKAKPNAVTKDVKALTPEELTAAQARLREKFKPMDEVTKQQTPQTITEDLSQAKFGEKLGEKLGEAAKERKYVGEYSLNPDGSPVWKYEDYSQWSRSLAEKYPKEELIKRLNKADGNRGKLSKSHLDAIESSTSMSGQSQRRAQSRNSMTANYEEVQALKNALELQQLYPERTTQRAGKISTEPAKAPDAAVRPAQDVKPQKVNWPETIDVDDQRLFDKGEWVGVNADEGQFLRNSNPDVFEFRKNVGSTSTMYEYAKLKAPDAGATPAQSSKSQHPLQREASAYLENVDRIKKLEKKQKGAEYVSDIDWLGETDNILRREFNKSRQNGELFGDFLARVSGRTDLKPKSTPFLADYPDLAAKYGKPTTAEAVVKKAGEKKSYRRPQVALPTTMQEVKFQSPMQRGDKVIELKGKQVLFPGFEDYDFAIVKPHGSKAKHNKQNWAVYETKSGSRITELSIGELDIPDPQTELLRRAHAVLKQNRNILDDGIEKGVTRKNEILAKINESQPDPTELHAGVNPFKIIDDYMTKRKLVNPLGTPEIVLRGKGIVEPFREAGELMRNDMTTRGEKLRSMLEGVKRDSPEDYAVFGKLDDRNAILPKREQEIRNYLDELLGEVNKHREARGQEPVKYRKGYITHLPTDAKMSEILDILEKASADYGDTPMPKKFRFQFEKARKGDLDYKMSAIDALEVYTQAALKDIYIGDALAKAVPNIDKLGGKPLLVKNAFTTPDGKTVNITEYRWTDSPIMTERGYAEAFIKGQMNVPTMGQRALKAMFDIRPNTSMKVAHATTGTFYRSLLGLAVDSGIKNLTQNINTLAEYGVLPSMKGFAKFVTPKGLKEAKAQHLLDDFNPMLLEGHDLPMKSKVGQAIGKGFAATLNAPMKVAEFINRGIAYHTAYDVNIKKGLPLEAAHDLAREGVRKTQFSYSKVDTSPALRGPFARLATQFLSYPIKQSELMYKWATMPGEQGKLARYFLYAGMAVMGAKYGGVDVAGVFFDPIKMVDPNSKEGMKLPWSDQRVKFDWSKLGQSGYTPRGLTPIVSIPKDFIKSQMSDEESTREYGREKALSNILPGGRYGKKVYDVITESDEKGKRDRLTRENTDKDKILKLLGFRGTEREAESSRRESVVEVEKKYYATRQKLIDLRISGDMEEFNKVRDEFRAQYPFLYGRLMKGFADAVKEERKKKGMTTDERFFDNSLRKQIDANL